MGRLAPTGAPTLCVLHMCFHCVCWAPRGVARAAVQSDQRVDVCVCLSRRTFKVEARELLVLLQSPRQRRRPSVADLIPCQPTRNTSKLEARELLVLLQSPRQRPRPGSADLIICQHTRTPMMMPGADPKYANQIKLLVGKLHAYGKDGQSV